MKSRSILSILLLVCILAATVPVASSVLYYTVFVSGQLYKQAEDNIASMGAQMAQSIAESMATLNNIAYYLMANSQVRRVMDGEYSFQDTARMEEQVNTMLTYNVAWSRGFIQSLYLFRKDGRAFATLRSGLYTGVKQRNARVYEDNQAASSIRSLLRPEGSRYAYYLQDYYQIDTQKKLGKLVIELNPANLAGTQPRDGLFRQSAYFLVNAQGQVLYAQAENGGHAVEARLADYQNAPQGQYYVNEQAVPRYDLNLLLFVPARDMMAPVLSTRTAYIALMAAVLLLSLMMILLMFSSLRPKVEGVQQKLRALAQGDFETRLPPSNYREINLISTTFNQTGEQLASLFDRVGRAGTLLNQAEYQMLESQINPHFFMNVLETISMRCLINGDSDTSQLVVNLGKLLEANVVMKKKQKIPLSQELEYVRYYLALQEARFQSLRCFINLEDENLLSCFLPKLTIQPIVENSFVHGLEDSAKPGEITISIWQEGADMCVRVKDNGQGFDAAQLNLKEEGELSSGSGSGIALKNIQRRVELLYGEGYGLSITSQPGRGTSVLLTLPMDQEGKGA